LPHRNARAQHIDMSRCWDVANFCPLVVSVAGVRVVEFGTCPVVSRRALFPTKRRVILIYALKTDIWRTCQQRTAAVCRLQLGSLSGRRPVSLTACLNVVCDLNTGVARLSRTRLTKLSTTNRQAY